MEGRMPSAVQLQDHVCPSMLLTAMMMLSTLLDRSQVKLEPKRCSLYSGNTQSSIRLTLHGRQSFYLFLDPVFAIAVDFALLILTLLILTLEVGSCDDICSVADCTHSS